MQGDSSLHAPIAGPKWGGVCPGPDPASLGGVCPGPDPASLGRAEQAPSSPATLSLVTWGAAAARRPSGDCHTVYTGFPFCRVSDGRSCLLSYSSACA